MATPALAKDERDRRFDVIDACYHEGFSRPGTSGDKGSAIEEAVRRLNSDTSRRPVTSGTLHSMIKAQHRLKQCGQDHRLPAWEIDREPGFVTPILPDSEAPLHDYIDSLVRRSDLVREYEDARFLIDVPVKIKGPIGLVAVGDPHLESEVTDWRLLRDTVEIIQNTEGMLAGCVGDYLDGWVGRLAQLKGQTNVTDKMAWRLVEWFLKEIPWLFLIKGNHDLWQGPGDPLDWIHQGSPGIMDDTGLRLNLRFPNPGPLAEKGVRVHTRHNFAGHSQYLEAFGPVKESHFGFRDHIIVDGDKHVSGGVTRCAPDGLVMNIARVGTFKRLGDKYAKVKGFRNADFSPTVTFIINPQADRPTDLVRMEWDIREAAERLTWLRSR